MAIIYLVRHPQSAGNIEGRLQGWQDSPLSDLGARQAERLARRFEAIPFEAVYTSPLQRCRIPAEALAKPKGVAPLSMDALRERHYGAWTNLTGAEANEQFGENRVLVGQDPHAAPPGGESAVQVWDRAQAAWRKIMAHEHERLVIVSHAGVLTVLLGALLGLPRETPWNGYPFRIGNASISRVEVCKRARSSQRSPVLIYALNDICHLDGLDDVSG